MPRDNFPTVRSGPADYPMCLPSANIGLSRELRLRFRQRQTEYTRRVFETAGWIACAWDEYVAL